MNRRREDEWSAWRTSKNLVAPSLGAMGGPALGEERDATDQKIMEILRVAGPLFSSFYSLASLLAGLYLFFYLEQRNPGGTYYTVHTYWERSSLVRIAAWGVGFGGAGLLVTAVSLVVRKRWAHWPSVRLDLAAMGLLQLVIMSLFLSAGLLGVQMTMTTQMYATAATLQRWADESRRFPENEAELLKLAADLDSPEFLSAFERSGQSIRHRHVYIKDALGPHLPPQPGAEPGVVFCAVSPELKEFWLTASVLYLPVGKSSVWLKASDGKVWVTHCRLSRQCDPPISTQ